MKSLVDTWCNEPIFEQIIKVRRVKTQFLYVTNL